MSDEATTFQELDEALKREGPQAALERLISVLKQRKDYHRLFDALLLQARYEMGLPLVRPTSFDDVPENQRQEFERRYVDAARQVGELWLEADNIPAAWLYLKTIQEPQKVKEALDRLDVRQVADEQGDQLIQVALYEGAHPVKGLELMLERQGICSTITALEQFLAQMTPEDRRQAARLLVRRLYEDLKHTLQAEVSQRIVGVPPAETVRELIAGRDWLFEGGNYHIDVSHLNAVVRFARHLDADCPELDLAMELAEYGSHLAEQFQYPGDAPFEDFYPAHLHYFHLLKGGPKRDEAFAYFRQKLEEEPDEPDRQMIAYVLVDLLLRTGRTQEAVALAREHLSGLDESSGFSFAELCREAGSMQELKEVSREKGDLVEYTAAMLSLQDEPVSP